jgi:hypothetical protein
VPERGITTSRVEVEVVAIREAANAVVTLWRSDPTAPRTAEESDRITSPKENR